MPVRRPPPTRTTNFQRDEPEGLGAPSREEQRHERHDTRPSRAHGAPGDRQPSGRTSIRRSSGSPGRRNSSSSCAERTRFGWTLTILMLVVYFGFIGLIAFDKSLLAVKVGGTASLGLFMGVFVILFAFALTGDLRGPGQHALRRAERRPQAERRPMNRLLLGLDARHDCGQRGLCGRPGSRRRAAIGHELAGHRHVPVLRAADARHHLQGGEGHQVGRRLLRGGRRHLGRDELPGDRRRLHVGGLVPRHLRPRLHLGLRRADLLHGLPGRLADRAVPDRRAPAQPRQVHLRRRGELPPRPDRDPHHLGGGHARGGGLLPDRPDGRRG